MTRRRKGSRAQQAPAGPASEASRGGTGTQGAKWLIIALLLLFVAMAVLWHRASERAARPESAKAAASPPVEARYVGTAACARCHASQHAAWVGSQHDHAMRIAAGGTVLGDFGGAKFSAAGITSTFFRRDGRHFVNTEGVDGRPADFEIKYTFGVAPLQQYLIEAPGGRLQALGIAWDSRAKHEGGQRWFHLYPSSVPKPGDPLHWTGLDQTWNYQCADCHSTNLRKGYDAASGEYRTTWSELNVGCEACHGPGSNHVAWAGQPTRATGDNGLVVAFDERRGAAWAIDAKSGSAARSKPRATQREIEACARCHARRGQFSDAWHPGQPFADAFRPSLIEPGLYYPDGQMREEVYNFGSFLQSRMNAHGVTCSDCHDPHSSKTRAPGNAVCAQCHVPAKFDAESHSHHKPGSAGAQCAACHMPTTTTMVVDPRHDHGFRIPRPDRTLALGTPNACNQCHREKSAQWATQAIQRWFAQPKPGFQGFAEAFHAGERGAPGAQGALIRVAEDGALSGFVRASAVQRLTRFPGAGASTLQRALDDPDALVRAAAVGALSVADPALRVKLLARKLDDPVRLVRIESARALAGEPEARLSADDRSRFERALAEHVAALRFNADRPEAQSALGSLFAARGRVDDAAVAYREALELDPTFVQAAVNLADLQRALGREADAEATIRAALKTSPQSAAARHALSLSLVRQKRVPEALTELAMASKLAPDEARFAFVYAVALNDTGRRAEAIKVLRAALTRNPYDREVLHALALYENAAGEAAQARRRVKLLAELEPENQNFARLADQLGAAAPSPR